MSSFLENFFDLLSPVHEYNVNLIDVKHGHVLSISSSKLEFNETKSSKDLQKYLINITF